MGRKKKWRQRNSEGLPLTSLILIRLVLLSESRLPWSIKQIYYNLAVSSYGFFAWSLHKLLGFWHLSCCVTLNSWGHPVSGAGWNKGVFVLPHKVEAPRWAGTWTLLQAGFSLCLWLCNFLYEGCRTMLGWCRVPGNFGFAAVGIGWFLLCHIITVVFFGNNRCDFFPPLLAGTWRGAT